VPSVAKQISTADAVICKNIADYAADRPFLAQNVLSQLRNLVEAVAVLLHTGQPGMTFSYASVDPAMRTVAADGRANFLDRFHRLLQKSVSHYTLDGDTSERLMLKYYEYLQRLRSLLTDRYGLQVLSNLEDFPVELDPSLHEYHEKIAERIAELRRDMTNGSGGDRYYIHRTRPFIVDGKVLYEVTFHNVFSNADKLDRIIAFTDIDLTDEYAGTLSLHDSEIEVFGRAMPITIIDTWQVSIRPCEFENFARLQGLSIEVRRSSPEYRFLMNWLTSRRGNLLDLIDAPDKQYQSVRIASTERVAKPQIFQILDDARRVIGANLPGSNLLRYLLLRMRNELLKGQYSGDGCDRLSGLRVAFGCIPFDTMPFCTSPIGHNPRYWDLVASIDATDRTHELLARRVQNNVQRHRNLYTPVADLEHLGDVPSLIQQHNESLYFKHTWRRLILDKGHVFVKEHEDDAFNIIGKLQAFASAGVDGYQAAVERWLVENSGSIDDPLKCSALKTLFAKSQVAIIYGAAGTGKSTMVDHIAHYFKDASKLFLAHTNPAVDNLRRRVSAQKSTFRTIASHVRTGEQAEYDLLVIDECSTVSNADLTRILERTSFDLLVLVGDVYQIEAIQFGNWFGMMPIFLPSSAVFELKTPYRTTNQALRDFWSKVRYIEDDITEAIAQSGYSSALDQSILDSQSEDEIILCLNYNGLYGINNVNRFLQSASPHEAIRWGASSYKVGDPILFNNSDRFRPVVYNNLKGRIAGIELHAGRIEFDVELDRPTTELDVRHTELEWRGNGIVRFSVYELASSDNDDSPLSTAVPFQVAYAVSIHKAQGLEFDSVKVVITGANEDDITHSIFYTAVTRAREKLRIFWTPETEHLVLTGLRRRTDRKDAHLLSARRGLARVT
jgi:AAA domain/UvrD-like helicase C-terminal domain